MKSENIFSKSCGLFACVLYASLVACSSADNDLSRFIEETKKEPGGRVEPLPEVKPYETFIYAAGSMRSPFQPGGAGGAMLRVCARIPSAIANFWSSSRSTL